MARLLPTALTAAALLATACVRVHSTPLASVSLQPVPADSVRLFALSAPAKYTEIAMMRVNAYFASDKKSVRALREKAGAMGANGIILLNPRATVLGNSGPNVGVIVGGKHPSTVIMGDGDNDEINEFARAVAIRYTPEAAPATSGAGDSTRTAAKP
jgi:hypothetical protein